MPYGNTQFGVPIIEHSALVFNRDTNEYETDIWFEPYFPENKTLEEWVNSLDSNDKLDTNSQRIKVCEISANTCSDDLSKSSNSDTFDTDTNMQQSSSNITKDKLQNTEDYTCETYYEKLARPSSLKKKRLLSRNQRSDEYNAHKIKLNKSNLKAEESIARKEKVTYSMLQYTDIVQQKLYQIEIERKRKIEQIRMNKEIFLRKYGIINQKNRDCLSPVIKAKLEVFEKNQEKEMFEILKYVELKIKELK